MASTVALSLIAIFALDAYPATLRDLTGERPAPQVRPFKNNLKMYVFPPTEARSGDKRPAVMWIHGGGWSSGTAEMFFPHARYAAVRGSVGISIEYRLIRPNGPTVADCLTDCKSAVRYIRSHAAELGVDPNRIVAAGDSSGGHLAAALGTVPGFDDPNDDASVSAVPNAVVAYNPITDLTVGWMLRIAGDASAARALSPLFQVRRNLPPMMVLHGLEDTVVPPEQSRQFAEAMKAAGNRCDLVLYERTGHAFVVPEYTAPEGTVVRAIRDADQFLVSLGYWKGSPEIETLAPAPASRNSEKWWSERHEQILSRVRQGDVDLLMIGDSITQNYEKATPPWENFKPAWDEFYGGRKAVNLGFSGDTTGNVLWRLEHGEVDGIQPKAAVILIGTNDTARGETPDRTTAGIDEIVRTLHVKLPAMRILLLAVLPSRVSAAKSAADAQVNEYLARRYRAHPYVTFLDVAHIFLKDGQLRDELFYDPHLTPPRGPLHPDTTGQHLMAEAIEPALAKLMASRP